MPEVWIPATHHDRLSFADGCSHYPKGLPLRHYRNGAQGVVLHTNGGGTASGGTLKPYWDEQHKEHGTHIGAHFQITKTGVIYQYLDLHRQAFAAFGANTFAVMIETEDDDHPERPWPTVQAQSILLVCKWLDIPARELAENGSGGGVGWHSKYTSWNEHKHNCPGSERVSQIREYLIPKLK